ncbi:hypothetical protein HDU76_013537 [Blyttiomyces sp. JEL0837]|nr:hypothetical protein HDU76_013537 [Blyttiomyces sp. JEL0837]
MIDVKASLASSPTIYRKFRVPSNKEERDALITKSGGFHQHSYGFEAFTLAVNRLFFKNETQTHIPWLPMYTDEDGDYIVMSSQEEFEEAVRNTPPGKPLKVSICRDFEASNRSLVSSIASNWNHHSATSKNLYQRALLVSAIGKAPKASPQSQPDDYVEEFSFNCYENLRDPGMLTIEPYEQEGGSPVILSSSPSENDGCYNESFNLGMQNASDGSLEIGYCEEASIQQFSEESEPLTEDLMIVVHVRDHENLAVPGKKDIAGPETNSDAERIDVLQSEVLQKADGLKCDEIADDVEPEPLVEEMPIVGNARSPKTVKQKRIQDTARPDTTSEVEMVDVVEDEVVKKSVVTVQKNKDTVEPDTDSEVDGIDVLGSEVLKKAVDLLDGLTTERFDKISDQLLTLPINSKINTELLKFQPWLTDVATSNLFCRLLLNKCEADFAKGEKWTHILSKVQRDNVRQRVLGNVGFICELFKVSMITETVMLFCIGKCLNSPMDLVEEEMEVVCKFMTSAGERLDQTQARVHMDAYFCRIKELGWKIDISPSLRQPLQQLVNLRRNEWKPPGRQSWERPELVVEDLNGSVNTPGAEILTGERSEDMSEPDAISDLETLGSLESDKVDGLLDTLTAGEFNEMSDDREAELPLPVEEIKIVVNARAPKTLKEKPNKKKNTAGSDTSSVSERVLLSESEVIVKAQDLLNRLTEDALDEISDELLALPITSSNDLKNLADLIYNNAVDVDDPLQYLFARLCKKISINLPKIQRWSVDDRNSNTFSVRLLNKCQVGFASVERWPQCEDMDERKKLNHRILGNLGLICELFTVSMITEDFMNSCIDKMLKFCIEPWGTPELPF